MNESIEDGVGIGRIADHGMPVLDGKRAGDDSGSPAVAFLEDFQKVVPGQIVERLKAPVIKDEKLDAAQGTVRRA